MCENIIVSEFYELVEENKMASYTIEPKIPENLWSVRLNRKWTGKGVETVTKFDGVRFKDLHAPRKIFFRGAIEKMRDMAIFKDYVEGYDSKFGTEIMASIESQLVPMEDLEASLYRKMIRPDAKFWLRIAFNEVQRQFQFEHEISARAYFMKKAKNRRIEFLSELVNKGCLPRWFTFDAGVYERESIVWCQPGRPEMQEKIRRINLQNPPITHHVEVENKPGNLKPAIMSGILPDDFDIQDVPFATPADWYQRNKKRCDELGFPEPNCRLPNQPQEPEPEIIEVDDNESESDNSDVLIIDEEMESDNDSDETWDSGLEDSHSDTEPGEMESEDEVGAGTARIDLWEDVMDPLEQGLFDIRAWRRRNPVRQPPPIPVFNNNNNPLEIFNRKEYEFNLENPPRPKNWVNLEKFIAGLRKKDDRSPIPAEKISHLAAESEEDKLAKRSDFKNLANKITQRRKYEKHLYDF